MRREVSYRPRRSTGACLLAAGLLTQGCAATNVSAVAAADPAVADPEVAAPASVFPEGRFSMVWLDAPLHRFEGDRKPLRSHDFDVPRDQRPGYAFVASVLEVKGEWRRLGRVETWLNEGRPIHCSGNDLFAAPGILLEVWVHEDDLVPVLQAPLQKTFDDGSFLDLNPGVPVVAGRAWAGGFWFPGAVDSALVGLDYTPAPPAPAPADASFQFIPELTVRLGGEPVTHLPRPWQHPDGYHRRYPIQDGLLLGAACGSFGLRFEGEPAEDNMAGAVGILVGSLPEAPGGEVAAGVPLYWDDGRPAGTVGSVPLRAVELQPGSGPRTCFPLRVGIPVALGARFRDENALVCVDSAAITPMKVRTPPLR